MRCDYCGEKHDESECPRQLAQIEAEKRKAAPPCPLPTREERLALDERYAHAKMPTPIR
jgi:hypothetical protein